MTGAILAKEGVGVNALNGLATCIANPAT